MANKIGYDGISTPKPKQTLDTSNINTTSSKTPTPAEMKALPKDVNVTPNAGKSKQNKTNNKNPSEVKDSEGLKSTDYYNDFAKKNNLQKVYNGIDKMPMPNFAKNRLKNGANNLNMNINSRAADAARKAQDIKNKFQKLQKVGKAVGQFIARFWWLILIILAIVFGLIPLIIAIVMQVGNSPHFYCNLEAPPQVKASQAYIQYCGSSGGNESIAEAAVSLAYHIPDLPNTEVTYVGGYCRSHVSHTSRVKTNGVAPDDVATQLYVDVHDAVISGDDYYASCDRGTCTAVRWAGADDNFPPGGCGNIMDYLDSEGKSKWDNLGKLNEDISVDELEPGDIMVYCIRGTKYGHIGIFVGEEAVQEKYPGSKCTTYAASLGDHCPQLQPIDGWKSGGHGGVNYTIYRNINPESSSKYKDIQF